MVLHPFQKRAREEAKRKAAEAAKVRPNEGDPCEPCLDGEQKPCDESNCAHKEEKTMSKKNPSRRERFEQAMGWVSDAVGVIEELKGELEEWRGNLPENLQNGSKAEELDDAIQALETIYDNLESATSEDVTFPGAFGK